MTGPLDITECTRLAFLRKVPVNPSSTWVARSNHNGHKECVWVVADQAGVTIPGVTVALEVKAPIVSDACYYLFTVRKLVQGRTQRAYQLEVCPAHKRSHNGISGALYGPHEHFGETAQSVTDPSVACGDWQACFAWFCQRCNLSSILIASPC